MIRVSRRHFIQGAGLAVVGAVAGAGVARSSIFPLPPGAAAASTPSASPSAPASAPASGLPDRTFTSTKLTAPHVSIWNDRPTAPGLLFTGPMGHGTNGLIMDNSGAPVWMEPTGAGVTDLRVQTYRGRPVLTYWSGKGIGGHGEGVGVVRDTTYTTIAQVSAGGGLKADLHEFTLTQAGTALLTSYPTVRKDLTPLGGPAAGYMYDCHVQEVDIASGTVVFDWTASEHIGLTESFVRPSDDPKADGTTADKAFDPFHVNSADRRPDGYLISARHTHTAYLVDSAGDIRWRLGGMLSDFAIPAEAAFAWQHDVRQRPDGVVSMFDNHYKDGTTGTSRGLILAVDEKARTVALKLVLSHGGHRGNAMGNVQFLDNGNYMVGWGSDPAATEFAPDGTAIAEATGIGGGCYRAYRYPWTATPATVPDLAVVTGNGSTMQAYASWNGATQVASWRFLTGQDPDSLAEAAVVRKRGFETNVAVPAAAHLAVEALDAKGNVLATSAVIPA
ncbi:arylsulfotransferase family protein [Sinomonas cellulolyticus]|uniref:Aryl-sulfate sulfotransferase n=1 Tax=Sinomonas cellulolyticus TaxID=2801916 RepID=A0ABS1K1B4_9MICC|nr:MULTISPECIES: arylsulfotransferase family protein [Sinomonas]MBL0705258.1 aryl-sulfate sulfotransferase [Sinomonas cellulolyticus]